MMKRGEPTDPRSEGSGAEDGFDAGWLALREGADARARAASTRLVVDALWHSAGGAVLRGLDLGGGSGNNVAHLARAFAQADPRREQEWTLCDGDAALLELASARAAAFDAGVRLRTVEADLASLALGALVRGADLVTASALLDLAGARWLEALGEACASEAVRVVLMTLNVDGRVTWSPALEDDAVVSAAFEQDMRRDKGLGVAAGPDAPRVLRSALARHGYAVQLLRSDWQLGPGDAALQRAYLDGVLQALEERPADGLDPERLGPWGEARRTLVDAGTSGLVVGHVDLLARHTGG